MIFRLRTPIFCLLVVLAIIIHYKKHKHLNCENSKIFQYFTYISFIFIGSIGTMEYTAFHRDIIPHIANTILDNIIYSSMIILCYLYTLFIMNYIEISKRKYQQKNKIVLKITTYIAAIAIWFYPTIFVDLPKGTYTFGIKAYITYSIVLLHMIFNCYYFMTYKKTMLKEHYKCFSQTMLVFFVSYILQAFFPHITISHMAFALEVLILYLGFENVEKYIDEDTDLFNEKAFYKILEEKIFFKQKEKIILFAFDTMESEKETEDILRDFYDYLEKNKLDGYRLSENVVAIISKDKNNSLIRYEKNKKNIVSQTIEIKEVDKKQIDEFIDNNYDTKLYLDKMTKVFNRNKYEIDKKNINKSKECLWYIIIDINNLKEVNDTLGHLKGDELITGVATVLKESFPLHSQIYRIGGDEFVIITKIENIEKNIKDIDKKCLTTKSSIPLSFAIGYNKYNPKTDVYEEIVQKADILMYENKRKYKKRMSKEKQATC